MSSVPDLGSPATASVATVPRGSPAALRTREEHFQLALAAANLGDWSWEAATDLVTLSQRAAEIFGLSVGPRLTWTEMRELVVPEDRERARSGVEHALAKRQDYDIEYRVRRPKSGECVWVAVKGRGLFSPSGEVDGMIGVVQEITARKRDEEKLQAQDRELQLISRNAPAIISHWDREHRLIFASHAFAERWGKRPEEFIGKTVTEVLGAQAFAALRPHVERVLAGETVVFEMEVPYDGIGQRYVQASYAPDVGEDGRVRGYLSAVIDMTDRRRTEIALFESEERLRMATRTGKVGLWDWDVAANRVTWTESLYEIHGVRPADFGATIEAFAALVHPDDRAPVERAIKSALEHDARFELEFRAVRPNGQVIWLFTNATVVREEGRPVRMYGATLDVTARKTAEQAMRESESRFRTLASHAPVGIFLTNAAGDTVFVNETWSTIVGIRSDQARGRNWAEAIHPEDRARVTAEWEEALRAEKPVMVEYRFLRPDGSITWVQGQAVPLRDPRGQRAGYIGTLADVTQRKAAEDRLRAQEAQLRLISTNAPIMLSHCDRDRRVLFVNRAYSERFQRAPEEIVGRPIAEVIGAEAYAVIEPYIDRVLAGESLQFEVEMPYREIGRRFMRAGYVPEFAEDGSVRGWLSAISDSTEHKRTEEALRDSEVRFRTLADNIVQFAWILDADGRRQWCNQRFYEFTGLSVERVMRGDALDLHHPDYGDRVRQKFARHLQTGEPWEDLFPLRALDGNYRWFLSRAIPIRDASGRVMQWFGTNTDVTELREAQEKLRTAQEQLQRHATELEQKVEDRTASLRRAIAQMEEFSYSVSHDLRAPLRAMDAYARALLEDYGDRLDDTARSYLERIRRSSRRMDNLTHDVLAFSRVARSEMPLAPLDLERLVRDVISQYVELQPPAAIVEIVSPLHRVLGHESALGQGVANLLTNAAKFVAPGVKPQIRVRSEPIGDRVRVWVEDNGIGIAPAHHGRLFRVFERMPTANPYEGTGVGLAILHKAVEKMGGTCGVESDGRNGSRFWIELAGVVG